MIRSPRIDSDFFRLRNPPPPVAPQNVEWCCIWDSVQSVEQPWLPTDLERKLSALTSKGNTWIQETGINLLHGAFGFLEWSEPNSTETSLAPLILLQVKFAKRKTGGGLEFR